MPPTIDLLGRRFQRWFVLHQTPKPVWARKAAYWWCRCDCGTQRRVASTSLIGGLSTSCGCQNRERIRATLTKHGFANADKRARPPEYSIWCHMIRRCESVTGPDYPEWGGRGIRVCDRWRTSFADFYADMGPRPSPRYSIDRRDNNGPYAPENCAWVLMRVQSNNRRDNRRITWKGRTQTLAQWGREIGLHPLTLSMRIKAHWPLDRALTEPLHIRKSSRRLRSTL